MDNKVKSSMNKFKEALSDLGLSLTQFVEEKAKEEPETITVNTSLSSVLCGGAQSEEWGLDKLNAQSADVPISIGLHCSCGATIYVAQIVCADQLECQGRKVHYCSCCGMGYSLHGHITFNVKAKHFTPTLTREEKI